MKAQVGSRGRAPPSANLGTRQDVLSNHFTPKKQRRYPLLDPTTGLNGCGEEKISRPEKGLNPETSIL